MIKEQITTINKYELEGEVQAIINKLANLYETHNQYKKLELEIVTYQDFPGGYSTEITLIGEREETEKEMLVKKKRQEKEKIRKEKYQKKLMEKEHKELKRLINKYHPDKLDSVFS